MRASRPRHGTPPLALPAWGRRPRLRAPIAAHDGVKGQGSLLPARPTSDLLAAAARCANRSLHAPADTSGPLQQHTLRDLHRELPQLERTPGFAKLFLPHPSHLQLIRGTGCCISTLRNNMAARVCFLSEWLDPTSSVLWRYAKAPRSRAMLQRRARQPLTSAVVAACTKVSAFLLPREQGGRNGATGSNMSPCNSQHGPSTGLTHHMHVRDVGRHQEPKTPAEADSI